MSSYENAKLLKERLKKWHDNHIRVREFEAGQQVLLFNSRFKFFPGKLKSRWSGLFMIHRVYPYGVVELQGKGGNFRVNAQRLKHYWEIKLNRIKSRSFYQKLNFSFFFLDK